MSTKSWYISKDVWDQIQEAQQTSLTDPLYYTTSDIKRQKKEPKNVTITPGQLIPDPIQEEQKVEPISTNQSEAKIRENIAKDMQEVTTSNSPKKRNLFQSIGDTAMNKGWWKDYSKADVVTKVPDVDKDGNQKVDKNGNLKYKSKVNVGAALQNFAGNTLNAAGYILPNIKDSEMAQNEVNDFATTARKGMQQGMLSSGVLPLMAISVGSMISDKTDGTVSATKGLGLGYDIGNTLASAIPFLGWAGKKMSKQYESDELKGSSMYAYNSKADGLFNGRILFGRGKAKELTDTNNLQRSLATNILKDAKLDFIGAQDPRYYMAAQNELNGGYSQVAKHGAVLQFSKKTLGARKFKKGGQTTKQSDQDYVQHLPNGNVEIYLQRDPTYEEWVKDIPEDYLSELYDLRLAYELLDKDQLNSWKYAVTSDDPDFFMNVEWPVLDDDGNPVYNDDGKIETYYPYHLGSIAPELDKNGEWTGNYVFLKLGKENQNPELHWETDIYKSGKGEINPTTHELKFIPEKNRYYYIAIDPDKFKQQFKAGGKVNVIPEGALHKNKHHLDIEGITEKGIPVIVQSEGGEVIQQAEVERQEIIFRLEVTKKLEELSKEGTDEAAIKAGKLLVQEILYNTIDNTQEMI